MHYTLTNFEWQLDPLFENHKKFVLLQEAPNLEVVNSFEQYFRVTANPARDAKVVNARLGLEIPSKKRKISGDVFSRSISENGIQALTNEQEFYRKFTVVSDLQSGDCRKLNRRLEFYRNLINGIDPAIQETIQEHHDKMLPDKRNRILEEETRRLEFSLKLAFCHKKWSR